MKRSGTKRGGTKRGKNVMIISKEKVDHFWENVVLKNFPKAKLCVKNKNWFMRILGVVLFFNPSFMRDYITVIGTTIYVPTDTWVEDNPSGALIVLAHEFAHMWDRTHGYNLFSLKYLSPQIWGLFSFFAFLGFVNLWFLLFLVSIVFLVPWPSPWRTYIEANGYAMTMYMRHLILYPKYNKEAEATMFTKDCFVNKAYYWMSWNKYKVKHMLINRYDLLPQTHAGFNVVHTWAVTQLQ